jgi:hypothetical protein
VLAGDDPFDEATMLDEDAAHGTTDDRPASAETAEPVALEKEAAR